MSVRVKPDRQQIQEAEALYARMRQDAEVGRTKVELIGGEVRGVGLMAKLKNLTRLTLRGQLALALLVMVLLSELPLLLGVEGAWRAPMQALAGLVGAGFVLAWFQLRVQGPLQTAAQFTNDLAGCNLTGNLPGRYAEPVEGLVRSLRQIRVNLRAVVSDVRKEIENFTTAANKIAAGGMDLPSRTEAQASALREPAASITSCRARCGRRPTPPTRCWTTACRAAKWPSAAATPSDRSARPWVACMPVLRACAT